MEHWLAENILKLLGTLAAIGWFLVQLGEWKSRVQARRRNEEQTDETVVALTFVPPSIQLAIAEAGRKVRHDTVNDVDVKLNQLATRFDKAGEKTSELASYVQGLPTRDDLSALWKELAHLRTLAEGNQHDRNGLGERIATIEGRLRNERGGAK